MSNIKIIEEKPISMAEVKEILDKKDKLNSKGTLTKEYFKSISVTKVDKAKNLIERLKKLEITRLKDKHIIKIVDIMPHDMDSLKMLISQEVTIKQEELQKILDTLK